jgi:hypothetical protein
MPLDNTYEDDPPPRNEWSRGGERGNEWARGERGRRGRQGRQRLTSYGPNLGATRSTPYGGSPRAAVYGNWSQPSPQSQGLRESIRNPEPINVTTPTDPAQERATAGWETYSKELQAGTAAETQRELQRYRDEISTGMESEGEAAISRGADPSLFRSRALESGKRGMLELQGRLADVSLNKRAAALTGFTGAAASGASERRQLHLGTMAARLGEQRLSLERADLQARLQEMPYQRLMELMRITGQYGSTFGGLQGGGGLGGSSRGGLGGSFGAV